MGKRCDCAFVLEAFERDPRLAALPLAVRALWLVLVRRMQALGQSALVLGSEIPNQTEIAMLVPVAETELETQLEPLLARGLLRRRDDGALACPLLEARERRAETARINGLKGGRPRRDGSPAQQRSMLLPVQGGAAAAASETQAKPKADGLGSPAKLSSAMAEKLSSAEPRARAEEAHRIGLLAADAAGLDPVRGAWTTGVVAGWLAQGADEGLILAVIGEVMARPSAPRDVRGLGYFSRAIADRLAARGPEMPAAVVDPSLEPAEEYSARVAAWEAAGRIGSMPLRRRGVVAA